MFRNVVFKGGTTVYRPSARADLEQVAKVLNDNPGRRVELGSRLGPGRPMVTDAKLRTDRADVVRNSLISLGVAPARLAIDTGEAYERVAEDVGRINGGRVQSMGVCILTS
jgi:outer membrane protein OmpA-like peptidoglycan-associated protein